MKRFDAVIAVDWSATSGRTRPGPDTIWIAEAGAGGVGEARHFPTRHAATEWLIARLSCGEGRVLVVFDVSFGWPEGAARAVTGMDDPLALWDWVAERLSDGPDGRNDRYDLAARLNAMLPGEGPFWGRPPKLDLPGLPARKVTGGAYPEWRGTEEALIAAGGPAGRPKSVWQLAYNGAVGSQTLTAMAALSRLRAALGGRCATWPFEVASEAPVVLAEVYLAHADPAEAALRCGGPKDAGQVRAMAAGLMGAQEECDLLAPPQDPRALAEGWVLGIGHESAIEAAAKAAAGSGPEKGTRQGNDCFALPPGIDWTPVDVALAALRASCGAVGAPEALELSEAAGRVLVEPVVAARANPPGANAAVDGWGFRHPGGVGGASFPVHPGMAAAGRPLPGGVPAGAAVRIMTGALLPEGVDTVCLQEDAEKAGDAVRLRLPKPGANVRAAGEDVASGHEALAAGRRLDAPALALATAVGAARVRVRPVLRVGVLSTGDELADPAPDASPDRTFDANRPMLLSLAGRWGHEAVDLGRAPDDRDALRAAMDGGAARCDAILTSGGASAGVEDHLSALMQAEGSVAEWRIAMKPGRPLILGRWRGVPVFGLPGNPVAAFTCALVFSRPALGALAGEPWGEPAGFEVPAAFARRKKAGRREFLRARLRGGRAEVFATEGSGRVSGLAWAEGFVELPDRALDLREGDPVRYLPFGSFGL
ncbi:molybdopterin molybdotransferase [Hasllibacter halocynthiae]|uniref:Molybdopterin molybdenumtransferase n=1 Tax=Hasllibacter halocynthiae TaxID=595589 RepID=A0A2T0X3U3_9RHOB|nr:molybdopterin-binding protein [Hasllibacter halocynthiae]PRY93623.1 molybdopterin molybdotransferase [Hasllibacter halocynthiae]